MEAQQDSKTPRWIQSISNANTILIFGLLTILLLSYIASIIIDMVHKADHSDKSSSKSGTYGPSDISAFGDEYEPLSQQLGANLTQQGLFNVAWQAESGVQAALKAWAAKHGGSFRYTIMAADGKVLGDTEGTPSTMENHNTRVCVMTCRVSTTGMGCETKTSHTMGDRERYVAYAVHPTNSSDPWEARVVRIAQHIKS